MKKGLLTVLMVVLGSQIAKAADMYCGANIEQASGSGIYNKLVFWEKVDTAKAVLYLLKDDGTLIKGEQFTPDLIANIPDGTLALSASFNYGKTTLFLGKVKRTGPTQINFTNGAIATALNSNSPMLMANGAALYCKEL